MLKAFDKNIVRSIRGSIGRFIAIAGIVALGCGFYAGLKMTAPDMKLAADEYYDATNLMDIRVVSTLGLTDADLDAIRDLSGVESVQGEFETDVMVLLNSEQYVMRAHSLPYDVDENEDPIDPDFVYSPGSDMNMLTLKEGRWPQRQDECIISADNVMNSPVSLGDEIIVESVDSTSEDNDDSASSDDSDGLIESNEPTSDDALKVDRFRIVGFAHSPYYVSSTAMGTTSLGSGSIDQFMYVPRNDFNSDLPYTEAFIKVDGASDLVSGSFDYKSTVDDVIKELEGLSYEREQVRYEEVKRTAQDSLEESRAEYLKERSDAEAQLNDAHAKLEEALSTIESSETQIRQGERELSDGRSKLESETANANEQLALAQTQIDSSRASLDQAAEELAQNKQSLDAAWAEAANNPIMPVTPDNLDAVLGYLANVDSSNPQYDQLKALESRLQELKSGQAAYDAGYSRYASGIASLEAAQRELDLSRAQAQDQLTSSRYQIEQAQNELSSGKAQLESGKDEYATGFSEYEEERSKAYDEFEKAEKKLADAQKKIDDIEYPEWLIMNRDKNPGVVSFSSDADRVDSIASFFPFIFFIVAALVALTTMTRMVEEERTLIGTFKALGYSRAKITSKYLIYAALASGIGSIIGIVALSLILPPVIMQAYAIIYSVPHRIIMPIDPSIAFLSAGLGVGITLIATWAAAASTLRESPAQLMLPRAPKEGKKILLERIVPLWKSLSFSWKVTFRNIFRYKKRLIMTTIGIAGCTALLLTGLGLSNSINDIIDKQFGQTVKYNMIITEDDVVPEGSQHNIKAIVDDPSQVSEYAYAYDSTMIATMDGAKDFNVTMVVPEDPSRFQQLWAMRERVGQAPIPLDPDSVIITEKISNSLGLSVGDSLSLASQDKMGNATNERYSFEITGIMENYVANYVFLGQSAYEKAFDSTAIPNTIYAKMSDAISDRRDLSDELRAIEGVKTVSFNDETISSYRTMLKSVDMIVVVLVVAAAALAFIVLYNLTNINITERQREIATLKVLGFTPHEVDMYIYRETILLTILGALIGLGLGCIMEGFVIVTAEVDYVMFGRDIHLASFVAAFLVTLIFAVMVMVFMRKKLARVDMIESLKSIE